MKKLSTQYKVTLSDGSTHTLSQGELQVFKLDMPAHIRITNIEIAYLDAGELADTMTRHLKGPDTNTSAPTT